MQKARLEDYYINTIRPALQKSLGIPNVMAIPKLDKIVINVGAGRLAVADSKVIQKMTSVLSDIAGQKPMRTLARKSIAGFKLREGMPLGVKVTLRGTNMYEFLDRLITAALPTVRDLQGVPTKFDGRGNYNLGIKECTIFPEVEYDVSNNIFGLSIAIHTTAKTDQVAFELLKSFGMPFRKTGNK